MCFFNSGGGAADEPQQTSHQPDRTSPTHPAREPTQTVAETPAAEPAAPSTSAVVEPAPTVRGKATRGSRTASGRNTGGSRRDSMGKRRKSTVLTSDTVLGSSGSGGGKTLLGA